ncbi:MAG TPA: ATP-binding protein [Polyangiaceae bacterium]|nr:ATP-binding protein [Polyangiaceae bacterium]
MSPQLAYTATAAALFLALALASGLQRGRRPLAVHVGLMCAGLFAYDMAEVLSIVQPRGPWTEVGDAAACATAIPTLELFIAFVGRAHALRVLRLAVRVYFGALAALSLAPIASPALEASRDVRFAIPMLVGLVPGFAYGAALLVRHARSSGPAERARTRLMGAALLLGGGGIVVDLASMAGAALPRVSYFGLIASAALVAAAALRLRVVDRPSVAAGVTLGAAALLAVTALVVVYAFAGDRLALFLFGALVVLLVFLAAIRPTYASLTEERARSRYLETLGRFSAQMAHDLRNPLASIKGAAQFLEEELRSGRPLEPHGEFLSLIVERADRMDRLVTDYQRMGRLELAPQSTELVPWLEELLRGQGFSAGAEGPRLRSELADGLPRVAIDRDLFGFAVENVVKNAREAMARTGTLVVSAQRARAERGGDRVEVAFRDDGPGMDVRTRERALAGFYTTKPDGTGLGLAFARRVIEAHGGSMRIDSDEGRGTLVTLDLPIEGSAGS